MLYVLLDNPAAEPDISPRSVVSRTSPANPDELLAELPLTIYRNISVANGYPLWKNIFRQILDWPAGRLKYGSGIWAWSKLWQTTAKNNRFSPGILRYPFGFSGNAGGFWWVIQGGVMRCRLKIDM